MNNLKKNTIAKITAFVLLTISAFSTLISGVCSYICFDGNFYTRDFNSLEKDYYSSTAYSIVDYISYGILIDESGKIFFSPDNIDYETINSMADFSVTDLNTNQVIFKNFNKPENNYVFNDVGYKDIQYFGYEHFESGNPNDIAIKIYLKPFTTNNLPKLTLDFLRSLHKGRFNVLVSFVISFVISLILFIFLMASAGLKRGHEGVCTTFLEKIPFDLFTALSGAIIIPFSVILVSLAENIFNYWQLSSSVDEIIVLIGATLLLLFLCGCVFVVWSMSLSKRIKLKSTLKTCIIYKLCVAILKLLKKVVKGFIKIFKNLHFVWKTALIVALIDLTQFIVLCSSYMDYYIVFWVVEKIVLTPIIIYIAILLYKLKAGGKELSNGNFNAKIDTKYMFLDFKEHAQNLNSIGDGIALAVDEKMKSERFKTELITNVSHDIKTPLTSVINYVDLIKKENPKGEKIGEYLDILERQSNRLKKLIEDLVEASKASSGNLLVELAPLNIDIILEQVAGEYQEKLLGSNLELIIKKPSEPTVVIADGRRLWRVFDNLFNNVCKHALNGSRVYLTLEKVDKKAVISIKNISKFELDIAGEELLERFVRGDKSRNTEGSGLGLSIAKSLTELQKGEFDVITDGDLFKAVIVFDLV
ncbi:MAG: HAMP domain-containing sensor histidine kinase [Acutalibacteraceae bacterium]|nr:HAMP domain-containing sensor histidine kinase [Acutalibacteraceae bacterium]